MLVPEATRRSVLIAALLLSVPCLTAAKTADTPTEQARAVALIAQLRGAAIDLTDGRRTPEVLAARWAFLRESIDIETIAQLVLGSHWQAANETERVQFTDALLDRIVTDIVRRLEGRRPGSFKLLGYRWLANGDGLATTRFSFEDESAKIVAWRLRNSASRLRIVDVAVDGFSLVASAREELLGKLNLNGGSVGKLAGTIRSRIPLRPF